MHTYAGVDGGQLFPQNVSQNFKATQLYRPYRGRFSGHGV